MTKFDQELALNRDAYESRRDLISREYAGQYVAIAFGKIVAVSPDFDKAVAAVERLQPPPEHSLVFPADEGPMFPVIDSTYKEYLQT